MIYATLRVEATLGLALVGFLALTVMLPSCTASDLRNVTERHFIQRLDHFNALNPLTFQQRYFADISHWSTGGPVFFVPGGEADLKAMPYRAFGMRLAKQFSGAFLALEHRFYGSSIPFGRNYTKAFAPNKDAIGLLSVEQAVADAEHFLSQVILKTAPETKIVAFGGSYSGKLSAYLRFSAPHVVHAALASSSPLLLDGIGLGNVSQFDYFRSVTETAEATVSGCANATRIAFHDLLAASLDKIASSIPLCPGFQAATNLKEELVQLVRVQFANAAMSNYPPTGDTLMSRLCSSMLLAGQYEQSKLASWAIFFENLYTQEGCLDMRANVASLPSRNGSIRCGDNSGCGTGWAGESWDYQSSTTVVQPISTNGRTDMFPPLLFSIKWIQEHNDKRFGGAVVSPTALAQKFGLNRFNELPQLYSRVIFTNGLLDPWQVGGVFHAGCRSIVHDGAHHSDLSDPSKDDTASVIAARNKVIMLISKYLTQGSTHRCKEENFQRQSDS